MSSFQFPADPSDGDIVVRGNLQAFYNAATNTWRVSEVPTAPGIPGPPGPPGPEGPPGKGVSISGTVDTEADLPAPNAAQFEFWIVDDTNTLHYSDGIQWINFGSPIQGPQGDPGEDGANGTNGQNGRGWYDTNIIDERPNNYQISFLSNDGLSFVTDNIMGAKGDPGDMEVATDTNCGCIKVGRGLTIKPDGTLNAGETYVDIETVPLAPEGTPTDYSLPFKPQYYEVGNNGVSNYDAARNYSFPQTVDSDTIPIILPEGATACTIFWFYTTAIYPRRGYSATFGMGVFRGYVKNSLTLIGGKFGSNGGTNIVNYHTHNMAMPIEDAAYNERRRNIDQQTKIDVVVPDGNSRSFELKLDVTVEKAGWQDVYYWANKIVVLPYRDASGETNLNPFNHDQALVALRDAQFQAEYIPPVTDEELATDDAIGLRHVLRDIIFTCDSELKTHQGDAVVTAELEDIRAQAVNIRNLPGTSQELYDLAFALGERLNGIAQYKFRFEP